MKFTEKLDKIIEDYKNKDEFKKEKAFEIYDLVYLNEKINDPRFFSYKDFLIYEFWMFIQDFTSRILSGSLFVFFGWWLWTNWVKNLNDIFILFNNFF